MGAAIEIDARAASAAPEALASWGWRAAFVSGIAVAVVGVVIRRGASRSWWSVVKTSPW